MYEVYLERTAERDLRKLTSQVFRRIMPHIVALAQNPRPSGCRKLVGSDNDWRIRIGEYRIIYDIDDAARKVRVYRVRHRSEAYR